MPKKTKKAKPQTPQGNAIELKDEDLNHIQGGARTRGEASRLEKQQSFKVEIPTPDY